MVQINFAKKEVNCKLVYYGPGLSGKTTNLEIIYQKAPEKSKGKMTSVATEGDRTLFFDFLPLDIGKVGGMNTKFQLYTVPGQVYYNSTRKLVLQGVDGLIFVADSQKDKMDENIESLQNLAENLKEQGIEITEIPLIIQFNKRDLPNIFSIEEMNAKLNKLNVPTTQAVAFKGEGVFPTLKLAAATVLERLNKKYTPKTSGASAPSIPKVVADINGAKLSFSDFEKFCLNHYRLSGKKEPSGGVKLSKPEKEKYLSLFVNNYMVKLASKEQDISVEQHELSAHIEKIVAKFGSKEKFIQYLKDRKLTENDYKDEAVTRILASKLLAGIIPDHKEKTVPTEKQLQAFYEKNKGKFKGTYDQEKRKIRAHILKMNNQKIMEQMYQSLRNEAEIKTFL